MAGCCLCLWDPCSSYCSIMLRWGIPIRKEAVFSCNKNPSQNTCFVFWVLLPSYSMTFLKAWHLPLLLFPSHPPRVCCVLFIILPSKGILNAFIISKHWFVRVHKSLVPTSPLVDSWRNQWAAHCRKLCSRLHMVALLWQLDLKSTEVEEFPHHRQPPNICQEPFGKIKDQVLIYLLDDVWRRPILIGIVIGFSMEYLTASI